MKKAQGLPISTIILAAIGLVVLILLFALVTGKIGLLGRGLAECPTIEGCVGQYKGDALDTTAVCDPQLTRQLPGTYVLLGQQGVPPEQTVKCSKCCAAIA